MNHLDEQDIQPESQPEGGLSPIPGLLEPPEPRLVQVQVPKEMIWALSLPGQAIQLAVNTAMLKEKEVYIPLGIDGATWSRINHSVNSLHPSLIGQFCQLVKNRIYPEWLAYQVNCELRLLESEAERMWQIERERADVAEATLRELIRTLRSV